MSATSSTFTKRNWFPSADDVEHVSVHKPCSSLSISTQFCKIAILFNKSWLCSHYMKQNNYWLTPCSRVLLQKPTGSWLVKKFPTFYGTWRFIIPFTSAHHLSQSWARSIQSMPPHPTDPSLILSSHLCLGPPIGLFPSGFPTKTQYAPLPLTCYMPHPSHMKQDTLYYKHFALHKNENSCCIYSNLITTYKIINKQTTCNILLCLQNLTVAH
jgi:hypothetical protein